MATAPPVQHDEALEDVRTDPDSDRLKVIHKRALDRFDATVLPQQEQRANSLLWRRFVSIPGAMWEGEWGEQWANSIKVEVDKVSEGVEKIIRDYRDNRIVPDFRPSGGEADQDTADTLDGMHRADSYHFKAQQARDNAFEEATTGGMGAYRLTNEWADPYDKDADAQRINPGLTIVDADQRVFFDGNSKLYDKSDAGFCFVLTAMTRAAFEDEHPDKAVSWPETLPKPLFDWFTPDVVIKCEYYEVEDRDERLLIFTHVLTNEEQRWWSSDIDAEEIAELEAKGWRSRYRRQKRRRIHKYTMSGAEVLKDHGFIAGDCIPVIPVYGKRRYIDNQERFWGYVSKKVDRQRLYNSIVSQLAEINSLSPREKPIFAAAQMPPHLANQWANQEIERHPYALVEPLLNSDGSYAAMGEVGKVTPPQLPPVMAAILQVVGNDLVEDQQDADEVVANTSADAMDIAATRIDAKSGIYLDNMAQSVQREGEVYLSMCRDIYYEPDRTVETMTEDGDDGEAILQEPYTDNDGAHRIRNDFTRGKYKVVVSITEATATRRDKAVKSNLRVAEIAAGVGDTELGQVSLLVAVMNQDGEGSDITQKYARKRLVGMGVVEPNEEEQAEMAEAAQNAQPDPTAKVLEAQAMALMAQAAKDEATVEKLAAETGLTKAKVIETLTKAAAIEEEAGVAVSDAETRRIVATKPRPANDAEEARRPKLRRGSQL